MKPLFSDATSAAPRPVATATPMAPVLSVLMPLDKASADALAPAGTTALAPVSRRDVAPPRVNEDQVADLGAKTQTGLASVATQLLSQVRNSDTGDFGKGLSELVVLAKGLDPASLKDKGFLGRVMGKVRAARTHMVAQYGSVERQMDALVVELDHKAALHKKRITDMEQMYLDNMAYHDELEAAADMCDQLLVTMRADYEEQKKVAVEDSFGAQRLADHDRLISRVEKRGDDLRRAMLLAKQNAPQLRLMQENARSLVQKFGDIKAVTLPAWKNAFGLYVLQLEQQDAVRVTQAVDDITDEALRRSADLLRQNTESIARSRQRAVVTIETLEHVQSQLTGSIQDIQRIEAEGRAQRESERPRLLAMEKALIESFAPKAK